MATLEGHFNRFDCKAEELIAKLQKIKEEKASFALKCGLLKFLGVAFSVTGGVAAVVSGTGALAALSGRRAVGFFAGGILTNYLIDRSETERCIQDVRKLVKDFEQMELISMNLLVDFIACALAADPEESVVLAASRLRIEQTLRNISSTIGRPQEVDGLEKIVNMGLKLFASLFAALTDVDEETVKSFARFVDYLPGLEKLVTSESMSSFVKLATSVLMAAYLLVNIAKFTTIVQSVFGCDPTCEIIDNVISKLQAIREEFGMVLLQWKNFRIRLTAPVAAQIGFVV